VLDLTFGINCLDVLEWCQEHRVGYINTAVEKWEDELISDNCAQWEDKEGEGDWTVAHKNLYDRTLYARHSEIASKGFVADGPTAVLEHGCNPGLVSHFVRAALDTIVSSALEAVPTGALAEGLYAAHTAGDYPRVAHALGLRVIHISEIDTQTSTTAKPDGTFVNTWSPMGFAEEALDWVQVGWGTHERPLPRMLVPSRGSCNQAFLPMHAMDLVMYSYVPHTPIRGMCIPHGEADTITEHLTVYDDSSDDSSDSSDDDNSDCGDDCRQNIDGEPSNTGICNTVTNDTRALQNNLRDEPRATRRGTKNREENGPRQVVYRPSVYYVYQCADVAMKSLDELRQRNYVPQSKYHVLTPWEDGLKGDDRVGVLLMFEDDPVRVLQGEADNKSPWSFWHGSILSDANNPIHNFNPTVVQVAASVVAAYQWLLLNPNKGICWPDNLPHKYILDLAAPFLGTIISSPMKEFIPPKSLQFADFVCSRS
jgi:homospermidine synthase